MIWVRRQTSDTWHWVKSCRHYPTAGLERMKKGTGVPFSQWVITSGVKPTHGEQCDECLAKSRKRGRQ